jgi:hypothetical protein
MDFSPLIGFCKRATAIDVNPVTGESVEPSKKYVRIQGGLSKSRLKVVRSQFSCTQDAITLCDELRECMEENGKHYRWFSVELMLVGSTKPDRERVLIESDEYASGSDEDEEEEEDGPKTALALARKKSISMADFAVSNMARDVIKDRRDTEAFNRYLIGELLKANAEIAHLEAEKAIAIYQATHNADKEKYDTMQKGIETLPDILAQIKDIVAESRALAEANAEKATGKEKEKEAAKEADKNQGAAPGQANPSESAPNQEPAPELSDDEKAAILLDRFGELLSAHPEWGTDGHPVKRRVMRMIKPFVPAMMRGFIQD